MPSKMRVALTAALVLLLSGCSTVPEPPEPPVDAIPVWATYGGANHDAALLAGTVRLADGCFKVEDASGTLWLVAFPRGVVELSDEIGLTFDGVPVEDGDDISLGGSGSGDMSSLDVPGPCEGSAEVWLSSMP